LARGYFNRPIKRWIGFSPIRIGRSRRMHLLARRPCSLSAGREHR
jgi:hypothetical protein